jgi:hypothetical protein
MTQDVTCGAGDEWAVGTPMPSLTAFVAFRWALIILTFYSRMTGSSFCITVLLVAATNWDLVFTCHVTWFITAKAGWYFGCTCGYMVVGS